LAEQCGKISDNHAALAFHRSPLDFQVGEVNDDGGRVVKIEGAITSAPVGRPRPIDARRESVRFGLTVPLAEVAVKTVQDVDTDGQTTRIFA
jgi:hypothetical protein